MTEQAAAAMEQLEPVKQQYEASLDEYTKQQATLDAAKSQLEDSQAELTQKTESAQAQFAKAQRELDLSLIHILPDVYSRKKQIIPVLMNAARI